MIRTVNAFKKSSMSYKSYVLSISEEIDIDLDNDWGWFVDVEVTTSLQINKNNKIMSIPPTDEVPNGTLYTNLYRILDFSQEKISKSESRSSWLVHATCLISVICVFIII